MKNFDKEIRRINRLYLEKKLTNLAFILAIVYIVYQTIEILTTVH